MEEFFSSFLRSVVVGIAACTRRYGVRFFSTKQLHLLKLCCVLFQDSAKWVLANRDWAKLSHPVRFSPDSPKR